jgi:formylglycine-generating enzyme required for sulfatase activity
LPSEAEWEYACRAGTTTPFHCGNALSLNQGNFGSIPAAKAKDALSRTCKVGSYAPNAWGLFDMHGNVDEWCADRYGEDSYAKSASIDPPGASAGSHRVSRGGSWFAWPADCRSATRHMHLPGISNGRLGFRVVLVPAGR